ncbi:uncharacterized protein VP01_3509g1, partial [Puccinia sorghi]
LKKEKDCTNHNLDCVPLDHIGKKLLTSFYESCLMNHQSANNAVTDPPTVHKKNRIKGFFDLYQSKVPRLTKIMCSMYMQPFEDGAFRNLQWTGKNIWMIALTRSCPSFSFGSGRSIWMIILSWQYTGNMLRVYIVNTSMARKGRTRWLRIKKKTPLNNFSKQKYTACQLYLQEQGIHLRFVEPFNEKSVNLEDKHQTQKVPFVPKFKKIGVPEIIDKKCAIPIGLPQDFYALEFLVTLSFAEKNALHARPNLFDMIDHFDSIIPTRMGPM